MPSASYFSEGLFTFLRDLEANNDRDWFKANKARYEELLRAPALELIEQFGPHLQKLSPHFVADPRPVGGSLFRIHRDTRFAKDKRPYKTSVGIHFRHEVAKDAHAPGYYIHISPEQSFVALGLWMPETAVARKIREAIVDDPSGYRKAITNKRFTETLALGGDKLKRPPRGVDPDHPLVEELKRKSFMASTYITRKTVKSPDFVRTVTGAFRAGTPLMKFLCKAVDVPF
ncbi:MAG: DUF2461 domain-containing protein [Myxococcales bacterium]|nr:DUF2461 domain-containing protein [Myxococcales bacterium]